MRKFIKIIYLYPVVEINKKKKILKLTTPIQNLNKMDSEDRILEQLDGNIQLKKMEYDESTKRWNLCFLNNSKDAPFKSKLSDDTDTAVELEDDEYIGQECCAIYDENYSIMAFQNNRKGISVNKLAAFFRKFTGETLTFHVITNSKDYSEIREDLDYKSISINFMDISKLVEDQSPKKEY
ncbi:MAG TPA: hypothetical protein DCW90_04470, partial [Lachnospiraceae bacterium]|nr:hypothetical protein [Lachnospiraceae bacterium]